MTARSVTAATTRVTPAGWSSCGPRSSAVVRGRPRRSVAGPGRLLEGAAGEHSVAGSGVAVTRALVIFEPA
ncbi:MAG TPA: hypothetical protein DEQ61_03620 [Streptomyces sp.]|nr:hypothetical protein [Streptomyces sp.]